MTATRNPTPAPMIPAADPVPVPPAPPLPYEVEYRPFGADPPITRGVKVRNGLSGELLTPEEEALWAHLQWLRERLREYESLDEATKP